MFHLFRIVHISSKSYNVSQNRVYHQDFNHSNQKYWKALHVFFFNLTRFRVNFHYIWIKKERYCPLKDKFTTVFLYKTYEVSFREGLLLFVVVRIGARPWTIQGWRSGVAVSLSRSLQRPEYTVRLTGSQSIFWSNIFYFSLNPFYHSTFLGQQLVAFLSCTVLNRSIRLCSALKGTVAWDGF